MRKFLLGSALTGALGALVLPLGAAAAFATSEAGELFYAAEAEGRRRLLEAAGDARALLDATDVEDALEAFNDFPGAVIPRELGSRLVRAYSAMEPRDGNKNIRRLLVASRKSLASRDARIFEDLLDQLVDRRLGHKSRRDLANALWSLRVDGLDRRVRRRAGSRAHRSWCSLGRHWTR